MSFLAQGRIISFIFLIAFWLITIYVGDRVKKGKHYTIRKLPALDAIDEAVGRCVEMGTPIMIQPGYGGLTVSTEAAPTIAGLSICAYTMNIAAKKGCDVRVPVANPQIIPVLSENLKNAYVLAGREDLFNPDYQILFTGPDQFAYTAAVQGIIERDKVKSSIMMGEYAANSLIIAESMARAGVFSTAGSENLYQIPWMISICDYMLVGEEMYGAAAYLAGEPGQVASIVTDDIFKFLIVSLIFLGVILLSAGTPWLKNILSL